MVASGSGDRIQWQRIIPISNYAHAACSKKDNVVYTWMRVKKIDYSLLTALAWPALASRYARLLSNLLSPDKPKASVSAVQSFHREENLNPNGQRPSQVVYGKILAYYNKCSNFHLNVYMSMVGPPGIGKTFCVQQLAVRHGQYVIYANLGPCNSRTYRRQSIITSCYHQPYDVLYTESAEKEILGMLHRVREDYQEYQFQIFDAFRELRRSELTTSLEKHIEESTGSLSKWRKRLEMEKHNPQSAETPSGKGVPRAIVCIDRVSELINKSRPSLFRSLIKAIEERDFASPGQFLALLVDATLKVKSFSTFTSLNHTFTGPFEYYETFPPICNIPTMDTLTVESTELFDGSRDAIARLFRYGHPLWGARLDSGKPTEEILERVRSEIDGKGTAPALALLSYRVDFQVIRNPLAHEMVSCWFRHVEVVEEFVRSSFEGSISPGDPGVVAAALLLLFAFDESHCSIEREIFCRPITIQKFMGLLFGNEVQQSIAARMETDTEIRPLWESGKVFFNHFIKLKRGAPDKKTLRSAFNRGAALFLSNETPGADILIPVYVPEESEMRFCLIKAQNRRHFKVTSDPKKTAIATLDKAQRSLFHGDKYLGIMMCLRSVDNEESRNKPVNIVEPSPHPPSNKSPKTRSQSQNPLSATSPNGSSYRWPDKNKKLVLVAVGLDENVYPHVNHCAKENSADLKILPLLRR
ncbi:hypothetical protein AJ79_01758 [Helicocarpus griseus UAMH5409]|uniref:Uncharacterized protein n=1 Tax=Helicocarpus griseus UAMH5409 TaxID=1447875 RepID=A0A2B7Y738_9EURO|nr:hypothetical protein AJ79_01758 [Helicocarpus griseus UAMH5409]